jgi:hypothetical protein
MIVVCQDVTGEGTLITPTRMAVPYARKDAASGAVEASVSGDGPSTAWRVAKRIPAQLVARSDD